MKPTHLLTLLHAAPILAGCAGTPASDESARPRVIVTNDGEVDDQNGFIRFLLYSNEFNLEGLIYSSSMWHWAGDGEGTSFTSRMPHTARRYGKRTELRWTGTQWMQDFIDLYGKVYANLRKHDPAYPSPEYLKSIVRVGNIDFEGEMEQVTEGSERIREILLDDKPGPVHIGVWGGTNTLARALKSIEEQYRGTSRWEAVYSKVSDKAVVYIILGQDRTYDEYVLPNWPAIKTIVNRRQPRAFAYSWSSLLPGELHRWVDGNWFSANILIDRGPLMARYYTWGDGQEVVGDYEVRFHDPEYTRERGRMRYDLISEWDSPAFFYILDYIFGLRELGDPPSYGGLGGRFQPSDRAPRKWHDIASADGAAPVVDYNPYTGEWDPHYPQARWIPVVQNDFAARAQWCVDGFEEANHAPVAHLEHPSRLTASAGETVRLSGSATDPDGDALAFKWWQYGEAGSYEGEVTIEDAHSSEAAFRVPADVEAGDTIHIILEVTDDGTPPLAAFRRAVITVH